MTYSICGDEIWEHELEHTRVALGSVCIEEFDTSWADQFCQEQDRLRPILGAIADEIQHYGSTAVTGLRAKPIIDMMAPVASLEQADALGERLPVAGYGEIDAGFKKRRFFRRRSSTTNLAFHLHLVVSPLWPIKNELLFRDWLRQHQEVARAYEALKLKLAAKFGDDMPRYTAGKTIFVREIVDKARLRLGLPVEDDWDE